MNERIVYVAHSWAGGQRVAHKKDLGEWFIFVGKRGGDLRRYKTETAMDKEMLRRGYQRQ